MNYEFFSLEDIGNMKFDDTLIDTRQFDVKIVDKMRKVPILEQISERVHNWRTFASMWPVYILLSSTCMTMSRSMTRMKEARKARDTSLVGMKSWFISSQLIQSVVMTVMKTAEVATIVTQNSTMRRQPAFHHSLSLGAQWGYKDSCSITSVTYESIAYLFNTYCRSL